MSPSDTESSWDRPVYSAATCLATVSSRPESSVQTGLKRESDNKRNKTRAQENQGGQGAAKLPPRSLMLQQARFPHVYLGLSIFLVWIWFYKNPSWLSGRAYLSVMKDACQCVHPLFHNTIGSFIMAHVAIVDYVLINWNNNLQQKQFIHKVCMTSNNTPMAHLNSISYLITSSQDSDDTFRLMLDWHSTCSFTAS